MKQQKWALVAGGSGFLGQYILWGLIRKKYSVVLCAARRKHITISQRLERLKKFNSLVNPAFRLTEEEFSLIVPIECDIRDHELALSKKDSVWLQTIQIREIWNCAAYMKYSKKDYKESYATNVTGSLNLINLARKHKKCTYFHVSTAFIGGKDYTNGAPLKERIYENQKEFFNSYDKSKAIAEQKVSAVCSKVEMNYAIFRPTIIIGDSKTGFTSSSFGFYEYLNAIDKLQPRLAGQTLTIVCNGDSFLHLIPVDLCAKAMLRLSPLVRKSNKNVFTIADSQPLAYKDMKPIVEQLFNISVNYTHAIIDKENKLDRLFRIFTARNHVFSQHSFNFSNKETRGLIGESFCSGWTKDIDFYNLVKSAYNRFMQNYAVF